MMNSIASAVTANGLLLWLLVSPLARVQASCSSDITTLYSMPNGTITEASDAFLANFTDYCQPGTPTAVCDLGSFDSIVIRSSISDLIPEIEVEGYLNFTVYAEIMKTKLDSYKKACESESNTKFCQISAETNGGGTFSMVPFALHYKIIGLPICIPNSCDEAGLITFANQMSPNITSILSSIDGVTVDSFNTTQVTMQCASD
jgi:hypothetical protein